MNQATATKLRNALAQIAAEWTGDAPSAHVPIEHPLPFSSMSEGNWREAVRLWNLHAAELLASVPPRNCPGCGGARSRWLFDSYDRHPYHECDECGCWFVPKLVDRTLFDRLFARSPEAAALAREMMADRGSLEGREADMARIGGYLDDLLPMLPKSATPIAYLDTGCGVGHSLRAGQARGLRVQGVEIDDAALAIARAEGLPVVTPHEPVPPGPYHLLTFFETLEHIAAPLAALERYLPLLAADGLVAITVPNLNALATRTLRQSCAWIHGGYNTPGHVNMFDVRSLSSLLSRAGLTLLDADGQFSANPIELFAGLNGLTRGAFDNLENRPPRTMPASADQLIKGVWPGAALVERLALSSPILSVLACRRGREATFARAIAERRERRSAEIREATEALVSTEADYKGIAESLQREIERRDVESQRMIGHLQEQIDYRDTLLADARHRFDRSIEGGLSRGLQSVARAWKRLRP